MKPEDLKIGDTVKVPSVPRHISSLCRSGTVVGIMDKFCKVHIRYGRVAQGHWHGKISEVQKIKPRKPIRD